MKLDTALQAFAKAFLDEPDTTVSTYETSPLYDDVHDTTITLRPARRQYVNPTDAGYDWAAGHPFVVTDPRSGYFRQVVAVDEVSYLKRAGYTHAHIHFNNTQPLEIKL